MKSVLRVIKTAGQWKWSIFIATATLFFIVAINLVTPIIAREVIFLVEPGDISVTGLIWAWAGFLFGLFILRSIIAFVQAYFAHRAAIRVICKLRVQMYEHLQCLSAGYYSNKQTGQIVDRVYQDAHQLENLVAHALPDLIVNVSTVVGVLFLMFIINPVLATLVCIPLPLILFVSIFSRKMRKHWRKHRHLSAEMVGVLVDNIQGMKEIQVFNRQKYEAQMMRGRVDRHGAMFLRGAFWIYLFNSVLSFVQGAGTVIIVLVGGLLALGGNIHSGDITAFLMYGSLLYVPVAGLARIVEDIGIGSISAGRIFEILDTRAEVVQRDGARDVGILRGDVEFANVAFGYVSGIPVLKNVSFNAPAGKMIALVGSTGAGKTTIASLLARFYDVNSGSITIDGIDIRDMTLESLRNQISIVLQDVFLFNGTIASNIAYGRADEVSGEEIVEAARIAAVHDFIDSLPEKYNTVVGERGTRLSGGQKQRIAIARAVLRKSPILILDEATSSVDTETEREIQRAIDQIAGTRTLIVIAHRLTTIEKADKVLSLENGILVGK